MQKISSYLYPNRLVITTNWALYPTEWRIVYQRRIKIYKGFKNDLLLDIKNNDQKRLDVSNKVIKFTLLDQFNQEIYTCHAQHSSTPGLATVTIPANELLIVEPQFLKYVIYIVNNDGSKSPVYGDTQFGITGMIDFLDQGIPSSPSDIIIDTFNYMVDTTVIPEVRKFTSEAALINPVNDIDSTPSIELDFKFNNLDAEVAVQVTDDTVIQTESKWSIIETFNVSNTTNTLTKNYSNPEFTKDTVWLRIYYTLNPNTSGKIDKVTIRR